MKNILLFKILLFVFCINIAEYAFSYDDTLKAHIEGTVTDIGVGHKLFVGKGTLEKYGDANVEIDYFIEYASQFNGKLLKGSTTVSKFSDKNEMYIEVTEGSWYVDFVPNPPEVIVEMNAKIIGGKGVFKNATGIAIGSGIQLYMPGTPTIFDVTIYINY